MTARFADDPRVTIIHDEYKNIRSILDAHGVGAVDGVIADLGISGRHVDAPERGFSYHFDAPLDMRMSQTGVSARDLVNELDEKTLSRIIFSYGEEKFARSIARNIVSARQKAPIETTFELVEIIKRSMPASRLRGSHPAKRTFQALRIAVNGELEDLGDSVDAMFDCLALHGRLAIITFHSLEDKEVKHRFAAFCRGCICDPSLPQCICGRTPRGKPVFRSVVPDAAEIEENNRARSARLRAVEKIHLTGFLNE